MSKGLDKKKEDKITADYSARKGAFDDADRAAARQRQADYLDQIRVQVGDDVEASRRENEGALVEDLVRRNQLVVCRERDGFGVSAEDELGVDFVAIPTAKGKAGPFEEVDLDAL